MYSMANGITPSHHTEGYRSLYFLTVPKILERCENGNPPEIQANLDEGRRKVRELVQQIRDVKARAEVDIRGLLAGAGPAGSTYPDSGSPLP